VTDKRGRRLFFAWAPSIWFSPANAGLLKGVALTNTIWLAAMSAVSLRYFFAVPIFFWR
jgi:hypothetical protein